MKERSIKMSTINDRIKERRLAKDLTLLDVAEFLGVKEATAQRYESGEIKNIKHETIASLAELFKCSPAYLMGWEELSDSKVSTQKNENSYSDTEILTMAANRIGHQGNLSEDDIKKIKMALRIALNDDN